MQLKDTHLAIGTIGIITLSYTLISYLMTVPVSESIVFGAFTAIAGLAGFEAGRK